VTEICNENLTAHASPAVQVRLKSISIEGHFVLMAETAFRPYLPSHCSGVTEIYDTELRLHALKAEQDR
jgi:hypothetical protein